MNNNIDMKKISGLLKVISNKTGVPAETLKKELEEGKFDSALNAMNRNDAASRKNDEFTASKSTV